MRLILAAALVVATSGAHAAETVPFGPSLERNGWRALTFRALKPVTFTAAGASQLDIVADKAASVIWREMPESAWTARGANWRWRVQSGPPATDLAAKGRDDRAIALYLVFARDEAAARAAKGATSLTSAMWWSSGSALVYVYGGAGARGQVVPSPHMGASGKLIIRQPGGGQTGSWLPESADLAADFRLAFGREPGPLVGVAISSDSDDTGVRTVASIDALQLR
jgi:hypothetical protein